MFSGGVGIFGVDISLLILLYQADASRSGAYEANNDTFLVGGALHMLLLYVAVLLPRLHLHLTLQPSAECWE